MTKDKNNPTGVCDICVATLLCDRETCQMMNDWDPAFDLNKVCQNLKVTPKIIEENGQRILMKFEWGCYDPVKCTSLRTMCPVREEELRRVFFNRIKKYNAEKDFRDHHILVDGGILLEILWNAPGAHGWSYCIQVLDDAIDTVKGGEVME